MKHIFNILLSFCLATIAYSQPMPDSLNVKYHSLKTDTEKVALLATYFGKAPLADSAKTASAFELLSWFKKNNDAVGADYSQLFIADLLIFKSDYSAALELAFTILPNFESRQDTNGILYTNNTIGKAYQFTKDYDKAIEYFQKVIFLSEKINSKNILARTYYDLSSTYASLGKSDSGIVAAQKSIRIAKEMKDDNFLDIALATLAENYISASEYEIAIPFLRKSMDLCRNQKDGESFYAILRLNNQFASAFLGLEQYDSVYHYAKLSLDLSLPLGYQEQTLNSYEHLYKSFEATNQIDSVYKYYRKATEVKNAIFSYEKTKTLEALSLREDIRQSENESEKLKLEAKNKKYTVFTLMGIGVITILLIFLMLSRSFITSPKIIEYMGLVALLIVFEFLNLVFHTFLDNVTNHSPLLMLIALVCIAAVLVPLHHKVEKWIISKMVKKNKAIRLAAAKKTIEELDDNS